MAYVLENLRSFLGAKQPSSPFAPTSLPYLRRQTVEVDVSIPANTPANASTVATLTIDPKVGGVSQYTIPKGYMFKAVDIYIKASGDVGADGIAKFKLNFFKDQLITPPLSTMLVSNPSRPTAPTTTWNEGDTISCEFINTVAVGASAVTNKFYIVFDVYGRE